MKIKILTTVALACCVLFCLASTVADISGKWKGSITTPDGNEISLTYNFKVDGDKLTGTADAEGHEVTINDGKVNGDDISFSVTNDDGSPVPHTGKCYPDSIGMNLEAHGVKFHTTLKRADK